MMLFIFAVATMLMPRSLRRTAAALMLLFCGTAFIFADAAERVAAAADAADKAFAAMHFAPFLRQRATPPPPLSFFLLSGFFGTSLS